MYMYKMLVTLSGSAPVLRVTMPISSLHVLGRFMVVSMTWGVNVYFYYKIAAWLQLIAVLNLFQFKVSKKVL